MGGDYRSCCFAARGNLGKGRGKRPQASRLLSRFLRYTLPWLYAAANEYDDMTREDRKAWATQSKPLLRKNFRSICSSDSEEESVQYDVEQETSKQDVEQNDVEPGADTGKCFFAIAHLFGDFVS